MSLEISAQNGEQFWGSSAHDLFSFGQIEVPVRHLRGAMCLAAGAEGLEIWRQVWVTQQPQADN